MKKWLFFFACFCSACSQNLPNKEQNLSDYVPRPEEKKEVVAEKATFDFSTQNFPQNCEWKSLIRIVDGDTIIVGDNVRVRLIGIDTPEIKHPKKPIQKFGPEASEKMSALLQDQKKVCLIGDKEGDEFDKYGRRLAYIYLENGLDINAEMLKVGLARGYFYFPFERKEEFLQYVKEAKVKKINLWE